MPERASPGSNAAPPSFLTPPPFVTCECLPPARHPSVPWLRWGRHDSRFGPVLAAACGRGLCWLGFIMTDLPAALTRLSRDWPGVALIEDREATRRAVDLAFADLLPPRPLDHPLPLVLRGTPFQCAVWAALLHIPPGSVACYGEVAAAIGRPTAVRAVGAAVGANPISILIPCHRVILKSGAIHNYAWGAARKRALLDWEAEKHPGAEMSLENRNHTMRHHRAKTSAIP